jgi:hypothetical protein
MKFFMNNFLLCFDALINYLFLLVLQSGCCCARVSNELRGGILLEEEEAPMAADGVGGG